MVCRRARAPRHTARAAAIAGRRASEPFVIVVVPARQLLLAAPGAHGAPLFGPPQAPSRANGTHQAGPGGPLGSGLAGPRTAKDEACVGGRPADGERVASKRAATLAYRAMWASGEETPRPRAPSAARRVARTFCGLLERRPRGSRAVKEGMGTPCKPLSRAFVCCAGVASYYPLISCWRRPLIVDLCRVQIRRVCARLPTQKGWPSCISKGDGMLALPTASQPPRPRPRRRPRRRRRRRRPSRRGGGGRPAAAPRG